MTIRTDDSALAPPARETLLARLQPLARLPKLHLSWPFAGLPGSNPLRIPMWEDRELLAQYVRISGSVPLSLTWSTSEQIELAAGLCEELDVGICVSASPYRRLADQKLRAACWNESFVLDLRDFAAQWTKLESVVPRITHILVDIEHWRLRTDDTQSLAAKYRILWDVMREFAPAARVIWYNKHAVQPWSSATGWFDDDFYPADVPGDCRSCSLYYSEWSVNQETYRRTLVKAAEQGVREAVPFLSLGGSQVRRGAQWSPFEATPPDLENVWQAGFEINHPWCRTQPERFPVSQAPLIYFWPPAGDPHFPTWWEQFLAYCAGARAAPLRDSIEAMDDGAVVLAP